MTVLTVPRILHPHRAKFHYSCFTETLPRQKLATSTYLGKVCDKFV